MSAVLEAIGRLRFHPSDKRAIANLVALLIAHELTHNEATALANAVASKEAYLRLRLNIRNSITHGRLIPVLKEV